MRKSRDFIGIKVLKCYFANSYCKRRYVFYVSTNANGYVARDGIIYYKVLAQDVATLQTARESIGQTDRKPVAFPET